MEKSYVKKGLLFGVLLGFISLIAPVAAFADEPEYPEDTTTITILHTNDMHGRFAASGTAMGIDLIAAIYQATDNAILVDAGDTFHGLPFVNFNEGANAAELMNLAGYSLFAPGNHDFNFGIDRLIELEAIADFDFVAANLFRDGELVFGAYNIVEISGVTLGFLGLSYPGTPIVTHPDNVAGLDFGDPVEAARQSVSALLEEGVDAIIALAHLGIDGSAWAIQVANAVPEIDVIIDGHSHTLLEEGQQAGDVLLAQSGAHAQYLGRVDITVSGGEVVNVAASVISREYALENFEPCEDVAAVIVQMESDLDEILDVVVGYSPVTFYGDSPDHREFLRSREVPIGNLVADSMRWGTGADFAIANSGGIRAHLYAGEITKGDIIEVLAFFNYAVVVEITPAGLLEALENGVSNMPGNGRFPQVSGFSFVFNQDEEEGSRVLSVSVDGEELDIEDDSTTFTIAINNFVAAGGDGYSIFVDLPRIGEFGTQDELLIAYMEVTDLEAVEIEGRIADMSVLMPFIELPEAEEVYLPEAEEVEVYLPEAEVVEEVYLPEVEEVEEVYLPVVEEVEEVYLPVIQVVYPTPGTATVVNCWYLNVRARGSAQAGILGVLRVGDVVTVHESTAWNWHHIEAPHITGWVYGGFIEMN